MGCEKQREEREMVSLKAIKWYDGIYIKRKVGIVTRFDLGTGCLMVRWPYGVH
jgi:hypothetical protein